MKYVVSCLVFAFPLFAHAWGYPTCGSLKNSSQSCFIEFNGIMRGRCEACRESKSCFMALNGTERELCEAYVEDKSCFMALNGIDRGWCEVLKEGKSCFMALDGAAREQCERGEYPASHYFWAN